MNEVGIVGLVGRIRLCIGEMGSIIVVGKKGWIEIRKIGRIKEMMLLRWIDRERIRKGGKMIRIIKWIVEAGIKMWEIGIEMWGKWIKM